MSVLVSVNVSDKTERETESEHREEQISKAIDGKPKIQADLNLLFEGALSLSLAKIHLSAEYFQDKKNPQKPAAAESCQAVTYLLHPLQRNVTNIFIGAHEGMKNYPGDCLFLFHCLVLDI